MTSPHPVPPLPQPQRPAQAAKTLAEAAQAAAGAWALPLEAARHRRAMSQVSSILRELGIAVRQLASWHLQDAPQSTAPGEFDRHVTAAADWLLTAWNGLDGMPSAEVIGQLPDPNEPGAALCRATRSTIPAWRQSSGAITDRDAVIRLLITATGFLSAATLGLAAYSLHRHAINLQAACACLVEVAADLTAAIHETADGTAVGLGEGPAAPEEQQRPPKEVPR